MFGVIQRHHIQLSDFVEPRKKTLNQTQSISLDMNCIQSKIDSLPDIYTQDIAVFV